MQNLTDLVGNTAGVLTVGKINFTFISVKTVGKKKHKLKITKERTQTN